MPRRAYQFGDCSVDPAARELRRTGKRVPLSPKVFDCLAYLIEHRDRAVGTDELVAAVLGKVEVGESVMRQTVHRLRRAIGDTGDEQHVLRTVPGFGYQFVAELIGDESHILATNIPSTAASSAISARTGSMRARRVISALVVLTVLAGIGAFLMFGGHRDEVAPPNPASAASIIDAAVLPVETNASDQWAWVRLGMMDLITSRLRAGGMTTVSTESVVALSRDRPAAKVADAVRKLTTTRYLVMPTAEQTERDWVVRLELKAADGKDREVEARDADVATAGRKAADELVAMLGHSAPAQSDSDKSADELLARIRIAVITDRLDSARGLMEVAPTELRKSIAFRFQVAHLEFKEGHVKVAHDLFEALLKEVNGEFDPVLRARLLNALGWISVNLEAPDRAVAYLDEAIRLLESHPEPLVLGNAYNTRGYAHFMQGYNENASNDYAKARLALNIAGDTRLLAQADLNEGILEITRNRPAAALRFLERSAERAVRIGYLTDQALAYSYIVEAHLLMLDPSRALTEYDSAVAKLDRLQDPIARYNLDYVGARAFMANGHVIKAREKLDQLIGQGDPAGGAGLLGLVQVEQARLELAAGRSQSALNAAQEAIRALPFLPDARQRAVAWLTVVRALLALGKAADAETEIQRFSSWSDSIDNASVTVHARLALAERLGSRDSSKAATQYDQALQAAIDEGIPADIALVAGSYGTALLAQGDLPHASAVIGHVALWEDRDFGCALLLARLYRALGKQEAWQKALRHARALAGERPIPAAIDAAPNDDTPLVGSRQQ